MAVMYLPTKFGANSCIQFGVIDIFQNPNWRPPPSWIFKSCKFGTFRDVNSVVLVTLKSTLGIIEGHWNDTIRYTSSYSSSTVTMAVSRTVFEMKQDIDRKTLIFHTTLYYLTCTIP